MSTVRVRSPRITRAGSGRHRFRDHQPLQLADVGHRTSVHLDDQILRAKAGALGRAALHHLDDLDRRATALGGESRRQRPRSADDSDEGAANPPRPHQLRTMRRVASLMGTARPRPTPATAVLMPTTRPPVDERPAGVAGVQRSVGLDHVIDQRTVDRERVGSARPSAETTPAVTVACKAERAADRHDELADVQRVGVAELGCLPGCPPRRAAPPGPTADRCRSPRRRTSDRRGTPPAPCRPSLRRRVRGGQE